jgi:hypothetical protein
MSNDRIYIRFKGRVLGPITNEKVLDMVKRGQITKQHELSPDGANWRLASEYEEYFPAPVSKSSAQANSKGSDKAQGAGNQQVSASNQGAEGSKEWYAHFEDANQGPVDEIGLKAWISAGKVTTKTMLWKSGMSEWMEAETLRPEWFARNIAKAARAAQPASNGDQQSDMTLLSLSPIAVQSRGWIQMVAICSTIIVSFGVIGSALMFISAASAPGAGPAKALLVITTLSGFVAWCCAFYICMLLFRISAAIQVWSFRPQQAEASQLFLAYNKFWKTLGVFIATNLIVGFLLTFMFMALGASLAPVFGNGS